MASGEVQLIGSQFSSAGSQGQANLLDGDFASYWQSNDGTSGFTGVDAGVAVVPTRYIFACANQFEYRINGIEIQGASSSDFSTGKVVLDTTPTGYIRYPRMQFHERPIAGGGSFRYLRSTEATPQPGGAYGGMFSEFRWIIQAGTAASSRPCKVRISPWGSHFPTGRGTVTLTCPTTSASIYYTVDGSTPTNLNGTLYSGPIDFFPSDSTTIKAVAYDATCSTTLSEVTSGVFHNYGYKPNGDVCDNNGVALNAFGGNIMKDGAYYYLIGAPVIGYRAVEGITGVWLYRSTDLYNWENLGSILDNGGWNFIERPKLLKIGPGNYVMWAHADNNHDQSDRAGIATASSPEGPWTWQNTSLNPNGVGFKDCNVFTDDDGTNYVIYTDGNQATVRIARLSPDGLTSDGTFITAINYSREAPVLFKRNGIYFLITSVSNYYNSDQTYDVAYITSSASTPLSGWPDFASNRVDLFSYNITPTLFNAQPMQVMLVPGTTNEFMYLADRWVYEPLADSRPVWLPLHFPNNTTAVALTPDKWGNNWPLRPTVGIR